MKYFSGICDKHFKAINPTKVPQRIMISQDFNHQQARVERIRRVLRVIAVKWKCPPSAVFSLQTTEPFLTLV